MPKRVCSVMVHQGPQVTQVWFGRSDGTLRPHFRKSRSNDQVTLARLERAIPANWSRESLARGWSAWNAEEDNDVG